MFTWFIFFIIQWDVPQQYVHVIYFLYLSVRRPPAVCSRDLFSLSFSETAPCTILTWFIVFIFQWDVPQHYVYVSYFLYLSVRRPPALCFGVPGLRTFAKVCLQLYNINLSRKRICARLTGVLDLKVLYIFFLTVRSYLFIYIIFFC
jgi:hypothetical protein